MFSFGRIFKSCSGGCQLLWSDPNKQAGAYDAVNKDDKEEIDELDLELLSTSDAVLSQPHGGRRASWSLDMESPIVRNHAPIVKNASKASSLERNQSFSGQNSSSIVKTRTPPRDAFTISNSPIVKNKTPPKKSMNKTSTVVKTRTPPRNAFENSTPSVEVSGNDNTDKLVSASTPDLSSKSTEYGPKIHSSKSSKKVKNQILSLHFRKKKPTDRHINLEHIMSCREICRRTFRGCLRIPGCKTICFKCILPPCCSSDSDDEKDEKDDEGYDSYGITASQNHLPEPHHVISKPPTEKDAECHDYVNESELELTTSHVENKLAEVMYVAMKDTSDEEDNMASKPSGQYSVVVDTNTCNNNRHDYVNESVLFAKSDRELDQDASLNCQRNGDLPVHTDFGNDRINGCREIYKQNSQQVTDSVVFKEYETRSLESKVADAVSNQQTLILLETDL